jgi:hypothetical protein
MIKRLLVAGSITGSLLLGVGAPLTVASAASAPNGTQLADCLRNAADRLARQAQSGSSNARRQFSRDVARCHRRFG